MGHHRPTVRRVIFLALLLLSGCEELHYAMHYRVGHLPLSERPTWPSLPDVPRFRFAGEIVGVENFELADTAQKARGEQVFRFIVGLDPLEEARVKMPKGLLRPVTGMVDDRGRIVVTDISHQAVLVFDEVEGKLHVWEKAEQHAHFQAPVAVVGGEQGEYLVTDADMGLVIRLDSEGNPVGLFGEEILKRPTGIARDPGSGRIFVADARANDIKVFDRTFQLIDVLGGPGSGPGQFNSPTHLSFVAGHLYVADTLNARVQVYDPQGRLSLTLGERGIQVGNFVRPKGVTADSEGNIYVVESFHDHLLVYNQEGQFLLPIGGTGKEIGQFYLPSGVWTDNRDRIFVADMFNGRIVIFQFLGGG